MISRAVTLAYPDFNHEFEVYTDSSDKQLGGVIVQKGRPLAFYSRKLRGPQLNYTVTEKELLGVVETLKEFRTILHGQRIKVYTDHKNLEHENSTATSQRAMRWRVLLEEFNPEIVHIKGVHNTVADAISRLDIDCKPAPYNDPKQSICYAMRLFTITKWSSRQLTKSVLANNQMPDVDTDEQFPLDLDRIAHEQTRDKELHKLSKKKNPKKGKCNIKNKVINDVEVVTYNDKIYIPACLREEVMNWYHHYLQHPGASRMEKTIGAVVFWPNMSKNIRRLCTTCELCQLAKRTKDKYGKLPPRDLELRPWHTVCVDCIGPFTIKTKDQGDKKISNRTI